MLIIDHSLTQSFSGGDERLGCPLDCCYGLSSSSHLSRPPVCWQAYHCVHGLMPPWQDVSTAPCVHNPMCPQPDVSTARCVYSPMCPQPHVSTAPCVHSPMCPQPHVSTTRYVHSPMCPQPYVSTAPCVHSPMCPQPHVSTAQYVQPNNNPYSFSLTVLLLILNIYVGMCKSLSKFRADQTTAS